MYEKNGEKYFVMDGHVHFWDASPDNWVEGQENYAEGWIKCFHAYQSLGPPETHWSLDKFQKYSEEDFVKDVFEEGYVDVGLFNPTYLKEWYREGFNTTERNFGDGREVSGQADRQRSLGSLVTARPVCGGSRRTPSATGSRARSSTRPSGRTAHVAGR